MIMSVSMYEASVPVCVRVLHNLSAILDKAVADAEARKIDPQVFLSARLAPDMYPLTRQVQTVSDMAKGGVARLAGVEPPSFPDVETTFPELKERIVKTIDFVNSLAADQIDGSEDRAITLKFPGGEMTFKGRDYLFGFVLPNLYFHASAAYAILRHNGVNIGKRDFLGGA
jgi:hypothetical protein